LFFFTNCENATIVEVMVEPMFVPIMIGMAVLIEIALFVIDLSHNKIVIIELFDN
jgi:hypothetical protein